MADGLNYDFALKLVGNGISIGKQFAIVAPP
jgi:hypothetical protein